MSVIFRIASSILFRWNRLTERLRSAYWRALIERQGGSVGARLIVRKGAFFSLARGAALRIGDDVTICEDAAIYIGSRGRLAIASGAFIGRVSVVVANQEVSIGAGTQIAHFVTIIDTDHKYGSAGAPLADQGASSAPVRIGDQVWIGAQAVILKGRAVGDRAAVGAGAVVTSDVPAQGLAVGNPARVVDRPRER